MSGPIIAGLVVASLGLAINSKAGTTGDEFVGTNLLMGAAFLQTGSGSSLIRTNLPWMAPPNLAHPALVFTFGFASDELFAPGEFFDSFSVTLRSADRSFVAPILTADLLGATLAPSNPDGTQFGQSDVQPEPLAFLPLGATFRFQQTFLVLVVLPPALARGSGTLAVSLFDNLDREASVAFISHLSVVPGPGTLLQVESSASASGPYAVENGMVVRHARRCLTLPRPGPNRFYRLRSTAESRITRMGADGADWVFDYAGVSAGIPPVLESSAQVQGPYAVESGVGADLAAHTLRVNQEGAARFFRLRCESPIVIRSLDMDARQMVIRYEELSP